MGVMGALHSGSMHAAEHSKGKPPPSSPSAGLLSTSAPCELTMTCHIRAERGIRLLLHDEDSHTKLASASVVALQSELQLYSDSSMRMAATIQALSVRDERVDDRGTERAFPDIVGHMVTTDAQPQLHVALTMSPVLGTDVRATLMSLTACCVPTFIEDVANFFRPPTDHPLPAPSPFSPPPLDSSSRPHSSARTDSRFILDVVLNKVTLFLPADEADKCCAGLMLGTNGSVKLTSASALDTMPLQTTVEANLSSTRMQLCSFDDLATESHGVVIAVPFDVSARVCMSDTPGDGHLTHATDVELSMQRLSLHLRPALLQTFTSILCNMMSMKAITVPPPAHDGSQVTPAAEGVLTPASSSLIASTIRVQARWAGLELCLHRLSQASSTGLCTTDPARRIADATRLDVPLLTFAIDDVNVAAESEGDDASATVQASVSADLPGWRDGRSKLITQPWRFVIDCAKSAAGGEVALTHATDCAAPHASRVQVLSLGLVATSSLMLAVSDDLLQCLTDEVCIFQERVAAAQALWAARFPPRDACVRNDRCLDATALRARSQCSGADRQLTPPSSPVLQFHATLP
ncbi:MAG: hypothetical protein EOO65_01960, partial [Methanosarcinales archaeon]